MAHYDVRATHTHTLTSHRNNRNTAPAKTLAPESLDTAEIKQHKRIECVSGWTFPSTPQNHSVLQNHPYSKWHQAGKILNILIRIFH